MEPFVVIVNGLKPVTIITKCSILDTAGGLDPPLGRFREISVQKSQSINESLRLFMIIKILGMGSLKKTAVLKTF